MATNRKKSVPSPNKSNMRYQCVCCQEVKNEKEFYKSSNSSIWNNSSNRALVCKNCVDNIFSEVSKKYGDRTAIIYICALLDVPFIGQAFQSAVNNPGDLNAGTYLRWLFPFSQGKNFLYSILNNMASICANDIKEEVTSSWAKDDKQNMDYAISIVGYDPFEDYRISDQDRRFAFNVLAGYLDDEQIREDSYKIQSAIQVAQIQMQCRKIDDMINKEFMCEPPNELVITRLVGTKKDLLAASTKLALESGIVNTSSKNVAGANTFTKKMKELLSSGFDDVQVNLFDIKTSKAMKQIADLSNRSILDQISLGANDYIDIIKDQREMIVALQDEKDRLTEENRLLRNCTVGD